jgi:hypothetical protein
MLPETEFFLRLGRQYEHIPQVGFLALCFAAEMVNLMKFCGGNIEYLRYRMKEIEFQGPDFAFRFQQSNEHDKHIQLLPEVKLFIKLIAEQYHSRGVPYGKSLFVAATPAASAEIFLVVFVKKLEVFLWLCEGKLVFQKLAYNPFHPPALQMEAGSN